MFRVTTLDPKNPPLLEDGSVDFRQDFFGKSTNLTVSGQLEGELGAMSLGKIYTLGLLSGQRIQILRAICRSSG